MREGRRETNPGGLPSSNLRDEQAIPENPDHFGAVTGGGASPVVSTFFVSVVVVVPWGVLSIVFSVTLASSPQPVIRHVPARKQAPANNVSVFFIVGLVLRLKTQRPAASLEAWAVGRRTGDSIPQDRCQKLVFHNVDRFSWATVERMGERAGRTGRLLVA